MNSPAIVSGTKVVGSNLAQPPAEIHLPQLTMQACALAKQSVAHAIDGLINGSQSSLQGVRTCEEKLDDLDRELDEHMAETITRVTPAQARELLACMKLMLDLERVGDLIASFAERTAIIRNRIDMEDVEQLTRMACLVENMLTQMAQAFEQRNVDQALRVLRSDAEIDRLRNLLLVRHTEHNEGLKIGQESLHVLWAIPSAIFSGPKTSQWSSSFWTGWPNAKAPESNLRHTSAESVLPFRTAVSNQSSGAATLSSSFLLSSPGILKKTI